MKYNLSTTRISLLAGLFLVFYSVISCKKLVEIPLQPVGQIPEAKVFSDSIDILGAIAGVYNNFNATTSAVNILNGGAAQYTGLAGDELVSNIGGLSDIQFQNNSIQSNDGNVSALWSTAYTNIYLVNACLDGIGTTTAISLPLKDQLTGELKVVRALYYFNLVNLFGGVPLITGTDYRVNDTVARSSEDAAYSLMIDDLTDAQKLLTPDYPSAGRARPNLYTADALLSKVYLYRQSWQEAASTASLVINSNVYSLEPDPNNVFLDGSNEAIWQLPGQGLYSQTSDGYRYVPYSTLYSAPNYSVTASLLSAFEPNDLRKTDWLSPATISTNGVPTTYYFPYKYKNRTKSAATQEDFMVFRLADLYLVRAEALAHLDQLPDALSDLNAVRVRAGLPKAGAVAQNDLLTGILRERRMELFTEGCSRWNDLKRTGTIDAVLGAEKSSWNASDTLFPVPLGQMQTNPFLKQNPGYQD
jgi:hypothetical protein